MSVGILSSFQIVMSELPFRPPGPGPVVLFMGKPWLLRLAKLE
jgi:hypothetical protein